jgi:hypothetical protein
VTITAYQSLDLGPNSPLASALKAHLQIEGRAVELPLTPPPGTTIDAPSFLTPAMNAWYRGHVVSARRTAIAEARAAFEQEDFGGSRGFLLEVEEDRIEDRRHEELKSERDVFFQQHDIQRSTTEIERLDKLYDRKRSEYGRDARKLSPMLYAFGLALIMFLEFPLNLASFLRIDFLTPALATASVFVVAIVFGFSSHMLGVVFRQWSERFGGNVAGRVKADSRRWLVGGLILFLIGAAAIVFSRSYLVADARARQIALGEEGAAPWATYGIAFIGNFAVYAAGVVWVMFFHDPVPNFAEERYELDRLRRRYARRSRKQLEGRQQQKREQARRELEQLRRREADQAQRLRNYSRYRGMIDQVRKVDDQVIALLESYRADLVSRLREAGVQARFVYEDLGTSAVVARRELDDQEFLRLPLRLGFA